MATPGAHLALFRRTGAGHHHQLESSACFYAFLQHFIPLTDLPRRGRHGSKHRYWDKMPGDRWREVANPGLQMSFMWSHPARSCRSRGCEFGQCAVELTDGEPAYLLRHPEHQGVQDPVAAQPAVASRTPPALYARRRAGAWLRWIGDGSGE